MLKVSKQVFSEVETPFTEDGFKKKRFKLMPKVEQLKWLTEFREYQLENAVYNKVLSTGKSVDEIFDKDAQIDVMKRSLAEVKYAYFKETRTSERFELLKFMRESFVFDGEPTEDAKLRLNVFRNVKTFTIRPYLANEQQTSYNFF